MKIWLAMAFWITIHGCQPYPRNSYPCTKSAQKQKLCLLVATVSSSSQVLLLEKIHFTPAGRK